LRVCTVNPGYLRTALTAGNRFAMPGLMAPEEAASAILRAMADGSEQLVLPRRLGWLSQALALLPEAWHDALLSRQPRKPRAGDPGATPIPGLAAPQTPRHLAGAAAAPDPESSTR
jgi:short-subunit dehydrogenase